MGLAFATKNPTESETLFLKLLLSSYRDGSGAEREEDGSTRANWRQIERCVAVFFGVETNENKNIFDLVAPDSDHERIVYGFSVKSKQLSLKNVLGLDNGERVYMEIANSPAKFWDALKQELSITEVDFSAKKHAKDIGENILKTVKKWHIEGKDNHEKIDKESTLDLENSVYLCLSYSKPDKHNVRHYQFHAFNLDYPENIIWKYTSERCLSGYYPSEPTDKLLDWYGLSGGQLKFYPRGNDALWKTELFELETPSIISPIEKILQYFPQYETKLNNLNVFKQ